tara:strand:- start:353 stop:616 length:264 start_codon:yes stop_codon:yes gene_type:complete
MKKALLIFILFSQPIISELVLEITKGSDDPYSIAIINFDGPKNINNQIVSIVSNDLNRTGEFRILKIINSCHHQQIKTRLIMMILSY